MGRKRPIAGLPRGKKYFSNFDGSLLFMYSKQDICILKYVLYHTKVKINLFLIIFKIFFKFKKDTSMGRFRPIGLKDRN